MLKWIARAGVLLLCGCAATDRTLPATHLGTYIWPVSEHHYGGFSGLEIAADGARFVAVSDRAGMVSGRFIRENGVITGIEAAPVQPLAHLHGRTMQGSKGDAEGLALRDDGQMFVSFEGVHRVWGYRAPDQPSDLPRDPRFAQMEGNAGLEALAIDGAGRLVAIPERSGQLTSGFPVWRLDGTWTEISTIARSHGFLPVGADFGPDGRLYVLERAFPGFGFRSRLRRFDLTSDDTEGETLFTSATWQFDNLEGLAVWQDAGGKIRATMVSDDNFRRLQRTQFVEFRIDSP
ncbi:esterase-like activity of phytase family protein [Tropicibacter naphthalenivorans]|uniref:Phytase-like domain-containing protein n=1 Tax=Tropicibacter naphthalenivorans TaxID=441103 RepID=A0A0P1GDW4_9RHOB|nr:esterase-like activity of phytase family protein [Tropicibacter naphthalenivorans]CUH79847.1 hypothetical protein TRN7648_02676 [Tropicibacter naphthalenivorans]SMC75612.1 hypothetical protein SAMN04488093_103306 [Tropicibacter naphthalenivorans]